MGHVTPLFPSLCSQLPAHPECHVTRPSWAAPLRARGGGRDPRPGRQHSSLAGCSSAAHRNIPCAPILAGGHGCFYAPRSLPGRGVPTPGNKCFRPGGGGGMWQWGRSAQSDPGGGVSTPAQPCARVVDVPAAAVGPGRFPAPGAAELPGLSPPRRARPRPRASAAPESLGRARRGSRRLLPMRA